MAANFTFRGLDELRSVVKKYGDRAPKAAARAMYREAEKIMAKAKPLTPVDTGNLRASGHVQPPEFKRGSVTVRLGFGGTAGVTKRDSKGKSAGKEDVYVGYAVYVHEVQAKHNPGTQWKYLETPFMEAAGDMDKRLAAEVRTELEALKRK